VEDDTRNRREKYYGTESVHAPRRISVIIIPHSRRTFHSRGCGTLASQIAIEDARGCNDDGGDGDNDSHNQRSLSRSRDDILSGFLLRFFLSDLSLGGVLPSTRNIAITNNEPTSLGRVSSRRVKAARTRVHAWKRIAERVATHCRRHNCIFPRCNLPGDARYY